MKTTFFNSIRFALLMLLMPFAYAKVGAQNNALHFDGVNDHVVVGAPGGIPVGSWIYNLDRTNPFSIELWIKPESDGVLFGRIADIHQSGFIGYELKLVGGKLTMWLVNNYQAGNAIDMSTDSPVPMDGKWHHVAMSYDGSSKAAGVKFYIDGQAKTATVKLDGLTGGIQQNTGLTLGARTRSYCYKGAMDDVRLWKGAISASDVVNRMKNELTGNEPNMLYYNHFNHGIAGGNNAGVTIPDFADPSKNFYKVMLQNFAMNGSTSNFVAGSAPPQTCINALVFPCDNANINFGNVRYPNLLDTYTLEASVFWTGAKMQLFNKHNNQSFTIESTGKMGFNWGNNVNCLWQSGGYYSTSTVPQNQWVHVAFRQDGWNGFDFLINGVVAKHLDGMYALNNRTCPTDMMISGGKGNMIAELRFWSSARSNDDLKNNVATNFTGSEPNLMALCKFDGPAGATKLQAKGSLGWTGTLNNFDVNKDWVRECK